MHAVKVGDGGDSHNSALGLSGAWCNGSPFNPLRQIATESIKVTQNAAQQMTQTRAVGYTLGANQDVKMEVRCYIEGEVICSETPFSVSTFWAAPGLFWTADLSI